MYREHHIRNIMSKALYHACPDIAKASICNQAAAYIYENAKIRVIEHSPMLEEGEIAFQIDMMFDTKEGAQCI